MSSRFSLRSSKRSISARRTKTEPSSQVTRCTMPTCPPLHPPSTDTSETTTPTSSTSLRITKTSSASSVNLFTPQTHSSTSCSSTSSSPSYSPLSTPTTSPTVPSSPKPHALEAVRTLLTATTHVKKHLHSLLHTREAILSKLPWQEQRQILPDQPLCEVSGTYHNPNTGGLSSSASACPHSPDHDALHVVDAHHAFANNLKHEVKKLRAAHEYLSYGRYTRYLRAGTSGREKRQRAEAEFERVLSYWSDFDAVVRDHEWIWNHVFAGGAVTTWADVVYACAVVANTRDRGGLEGVNAQMRDYGRAHPGEVVKLPEFTRPEGHSGRWRGEGPMRSTEGDDVVLGIEEKRRAGPAVKMVKVSGKMVQVDPRIVEWEQEKTPPTDLRGGRRTPFYLPDGVWVVVLKVRGLGKRLKGKRKTDAGGKKGKGVEGSGCDGLGRLMWGD